MLRRGVYNSIAELMHYESINILSSKYPLMIWHPTNLKNESGQLWVNGKLMTGQEEIAIEFKPTGWICTDEPNVLHSMSEKINILQ